MAHELEIVRSLPDTGHGVLIRQGRDAVVARLDLTGLEAIVAVLSGREATVRRADELRAQHGDAPAAWLPPFIRTLFPEEMTS